MKREGWGEIGVSEACFIGSSRDLKLLTRPTHDPPLTRGATCLLITIHSIHYGRGALYDSTYTARICANAVSWLDARLARTYPSTSLVRSRPPSLWRSGVRRPRPELLLILVNRVYSSMLNCTRPHPGYHDSDPTHPLVNDIASLQCPPSG